MADGIMVARGDMGVEIDFAEIPSIQKNLIDQCHEPPVRSALPLPRCWIP